MWYFLCPVQIKAQLPAVFFSRLNAFLFVLHVCCLTRFQVSHLIFLCCFRARSHCRFYYKIRLIIDTFIPFCIPQTGAFITWSNWNKNAYQKHYVRHGEYIITKFKKMFWIQSVSKFLICIYVYKANMDEILTIKDCRNIFHRTFF